MVGLTGEPKEPGRVRVMRRVVGGVAAVLGLRQQLSRLLRVELVAVQAGVVSGEPRRQYAVGRHHGVFQQHLGQRFPVNGVVEGQPDVGVIEGRLVGVHAYIDRVELRRPLVKLAVQRVGGVVELFQRRCTYSAPMKLVVLVHQQPVAPRRD